MKNFLRCLIFYKVIQKDENLHFTCSFFQETTQLFLKLQDQILWKGKVVELRRQGLVLVLVISLIIQSSWWEGNEIKDFWVSSLQKKFF